VPKFHFHLTLTRRVWALVLLALVTMAGGTGMALYQFNALTQDRGKAELRREVEIAGASLKDAASATAEDRAAAIRGALEKLRSVRFGESGYFFVIDYDGVSRLSPATPELEGRSLLDIKDADGGFPFREMRALVRSDGGGFAVYHWKKPGESGDRKTSAKTSYVLAIPELELMIGSGVYLDDIFSQIFGVVGRISLNN
jgi:methyl-accepting chemotaxis protein